MQPHEYKHEVVLYCWNDRCMDILLLKLNGKERIVKCPHCHEREVYAQPNPNSFIQNNYERILMKNIRREITKEYTDKLMVRKLVMCIFKVR